jgi:hypothetical protein
MIIFLSVINCILLHWRKKLTLAWYAFIFWFDPLSEITWPLRQICLLASENNLIQLIWRSVDRSVDRETLLLPELCTVAFAIVTRKRAMTANNWGHSQSIHVERIIKYSGEIPYLDFLFLVLIRLYILKNK